VIKTFADKRTKELYEIGTSRRFSPNLWARALRKLEFIDLATTVADLKIPPSNRLHRLERDRSGQYSVSINDQWRICFRFEMEMRLTWKSQIIIEETAPWAFPTNELARFARLIRA
jgi:toxin HigB-1